MRRDAAHLTLILAAGTLFGACVAPPDALTSPSSDGAEPPTRVQELIGGCDEFLCGANGPMIGGVPFWEIDANPVLPLDDAGGLTIAKVVGPPGVAGRLVVDGAQVTLVAPGQPTLSRGRLVGTRISIVGPPAAGTSGPPRTFTVTIAAYHPVAYVPGASGPPIESYRLSWQEDAAPLRAAAAPTANVVTTAVDVCPALMTNDGVVSGDAILYGGERFDPHSGLITASDQAAGTWVNVACAGDLRAKLARIGYYPATQHTTVEDRQAAVWMFSARYCGAQSYTHLGVKLDWRLRGDASLPPAGDTREAIWTSHGAACLTTPRAVDRGDVACAAALDPCDPVAFDAHWQLDGVLASSFPPAKP